MANPYEGQVDAGKLLDIVTSDDQTIYVLFFDSRHFDHYAKAPKDPSKPVYYLWGVLDDPMKQALLQLDRNNVLPMSYSGVSFCPTSDTIARAMKRDPLVYWLDVAGLIGA